jgi:glutaredoxin-related protein
VNIEIYTKDDCVYCLQTKAFLVNHGIHYYEHKLNEDFTRETLKEMYTNAVSFPVIVIDGFYIGGYSQLAEQLTEKNSSSQQLLNE